MSELDFPKFDNDEWDFMPADKRENLVIELFKNQFTYNRNSVPLFSSVYNDISLDKLKSISDFIKNVPIIDKNYLRGIASPYDLLPMSLREDMSSIHLHRGTGGTTGKPTSIFYTKNDWSAILGAMTRALKELKGLKKPIVAFNGYNQGHISGPIFDDTIRSLGGISITRNFGSDDERALQQMIDHKCNLIIAPSISTHKGGSVEHLLEVDARLGTNYINGDNIDAIFCSSTNLTPELYDELKSLGIKYIYNYYGSTEILPTAISCQESPFDLHLLPGHIALFVVNSKQEHVKNGEKGLVIASRIGGYDDSGEVNVNESTQLLNYVVGDEVLYIDEPCACGRTTPRIRDVNRVKNIKDKLEGGCETW